MAKKLTPYKRPLVGKPTKEKTKAGRTVYKTKEGERVSEKSATIEINKIFYNVPSIYAGKKYTDDELREAIKNNRIIPTSVHDSKKEAIEAAKKRSNELNKGGAMLNKQMEMFQDGGLQDEGNTIDKESGNDVPSGSLKKEVRDDVPAMLSEGEFVIPADVVRYIGLNKLMQMRQEAKMGLRMMEKMGQMGNSEEAEIPDDLPFGITDIVVMEDDDDDDDEKEMAQGGIIYAQEGTDVSKGVGAIRYDDGTIDNSAMMDAFNKRQPQVDKYGNTKPKLVGVNFELVNGEWVKSGAVLPDNMDKYTPQKDWDIDFYTRSKEPVAPQPTSEKNYHTDRYGMPMVELPPQQPQQTQFEKMMGYGAGQGSNPYGARRVPYTKADGSTVNILEDYMGRAMESTEGLTRSTPYQAGPVTGGDVTTGGGETTPVQPILAPTQKIDTVGGGMSKADEQRDLDRASLAVKSTAKIKNLMDSDPDYTGLTKEQAEQKYYDPATSFKRLKQDLKKFGSDFGNDFGNKFGQGLNKNPIVKSLNESLENLAGSLGFDVDYDGNVFGSSTPPPQKKSNNGAQKKSNNSGGDTKADEQKNKDSRTDDTKKDVKKAMSETTSKRKTNKESVEKYGAMNRGGLMKKNYP